MEFENQNLPTTLATALIYRDFVNLINYYTNEDSFHVSARDRIAGQGKVQNFSK